MRHKGVRDKGIRQSLMEKEVMYVIDCFLGVC